MTIASSNGKTDPPVRKWFLRKGSTPLLRLLTVLRLTAGARSGFLKDAGVLTAGNVVSQAIWIGSAPILTRIYAPEVFGVWALFTSIAVILTNITTWRYELAIVLPDDDIEAADVIVLCVLLSTLVTGLVTVLVILFSRWEFILTVTAPGLLIFIPLLTLIAATQKICQFTAVRHRRFSAVSTFVVLQAGLVVGLQIAFGLTWRDDAAHLLAASLIGNLVAVMAFVGNAFKPKLFALMKASLRHPRRIVANARRYRNFPLYSAPYGLLGVVTQRLLFVLLAAFASTTAVGLFGLAMRTVYLPVFVVAGAFSQAFFRRARSDLTSGDVERLVRQVLMYQVTFATPAAVLFMLNGESIFIFVFGEEWRVGGSYAELLTAPALLLLFTAWLDRIYDILGRQRLSLFLEIMYGFVMLLAVAAALWLELGAYFVVATFAAITAMYQVVWAGVTFHIARFSPRIYLEIVAWLFILAVLTTSIHVLLLWAPHPTVYVLGCSVFVALIASAALLHLSRASFGEADSPRW